MSVTEDHDFSQPHELSIEQRNAIDLLVTGISDREVGEAVGVARETVTRWRNENPYFKAELNCRRKEVWSANYDRLCNLLPKAIDTLERTLEEGDKKMALEMLKCMKVYGNVGTPEGPDDVDLVIRKDAGDWAENQVMASPPSGEPLRDFLEHDRLHARLTLDRMVELWNEWYDDDE